MAELADAPDSKSDGPCAHEGSTPSLRTIPLSKVNKEASMLNPINVSWGTDPEGFFTRDGEVIGSERVLPEEGFNVRFAGNVVRDGVQFELNPTASHSLVVLGTNIGKLLVAAEAAAHKNGAKLCFDGLVEVSAKELGSLTPTNQVLGCQPSQNVYGANPIDVDAKTYRKRSAGGHLHAGFYHAKLREDLVNIIPLYDVFVGNTAVLLDRDPGAAERRQNYGRAGECRFPGHGLEYRTTSNFWLRGYPLMSLVYGLSNIAMSVAYQKSQSNLEYWDWLIGNVNIDNIITAINTNNFDLAAANFEVLIPFLEKNITGESFGLTPKIIPQFLAFAKDVNKSGIEKYFPVETIVARWNNPAGFKGFNSFLAGL